MVAFLFLLPTQLALHFWPTSSFVYGIRVDFLSPTLYLTDIIFFLLFLVYLVKGKNYPSKTIGAKGKTASSYFVEQKYLLPWFFILSFFAFVNIFYSASPMISLYRWFKFLESCLVVFYFSRQKVVSLSVFTRTIFYSIITFSLIGILQFINRGTTGGIFYFLGERSFTASTPGIALVSIFGREFMRSYSTFSHPNSLAGFLGTSILFIFLSGVLKKRPVNILGVLIVLLCFVLTFSLSSYLGIFLALSLILFHQNKELFSPFVKLLFFSFVVISLLLPVMSPWIMSNVGGLGQSTSQRLDLAYISGQMIEKNFLLGQGLGTFIIGIPVFKGLFTYSWILQPVHNIYLLTFAETGILGLLLFVYFVYKLIINVLKRNELLFLIPIFFILFTGLFDHYSLTLQQNLLLFAVFIGCSLHVKMT